MQSTTIKRDTIKQIVTDVHIELSVHTFYVAKSVPNWQFQSVIFSTENIKLKVLKVLCLRNSTKFRIDILLQWFNLESH